MKIKENINLEILLDYGFVKVDKEEEDERDDSTLSYYDYSFNIGHSRRGQFYYLLVSEKSRIINIYASKSDGSGCSIELTSKLIDLFENGLIEK